MWRTLAESSTGVNQVETRDMLAGASGVGVGTTILRCIGQISAVCQPDNAANRPFLRFGILVGPTPTGAEVDFNNMNDHDWLLYRTSVIGEHPYAVGDQLGTINGDNTALWDVEGRRTLQAGESAWFLSEFRRPDLSFNLRWDIWLSRVLYTPA